jgi:hypothetical protein
MPISAWFDDKTGSDISAWALSVVDQIVALSITTTSIPTMAAGVYSAVQFTTNRVYNGTWSADLPAGLSMNPITGVLFGTPEVVGTFLVTVRVSDDDGPPATRDYNLLVTGDETRWRTIARTPAVWVLIPRT